MKFLIIVKPRTVPPPSVLRSHKEWVLNQEKRGRFEMPHCFAASGGGFTIVNADNLEQLNDVQFEAPAGPYCDLEIYPLVDFARQMDRLCEALEKHN